MDIVNEPRKLTERFETDTNWLIKKTCDTAQEITLADGSATTPTDFIVELHEYFPKTYPTILSWRIEKCQLIENRRGRKISRKRKFEDALECSEIKLFRKKPSIDEIDIM